MSGYDTPTGRRLEVGPGGDTSNVHVLPRADDKALEVARKNWPEAKEADFERDGRIWRDRATGVEYRRQRGNPLFGPGAGEVDLFFEADGCLYFLREAGKPEAVETKLFGDMSGRKAGPHERRAITLEETIAKAGLGS